MKSFLRTGNRGYPADYLLSRVKGRRADMIIRWEPLLLSNAPEEYLASSRYRGVAVDRPEEVAWRFFLKEIGWLYFQMNDSLQDIFMPFFQYLEIRTVSLCLRLKTTNEDVKIKELLDLSLLSVKFKKNLLKSENILYAIAGIEDFFNSISERFGGIKEILLKDGTKGVEQHLTDVYLEYVTGSKLHPDIRDIFTHIIDLKNTIALYKNLWWNIKRPPSFIKGGKVSEKKLGRIIGKEDIFEIVSIVHKLTGIKIDASDIKDIENIFFKGITKYLRRKGRGPSDISFILDYLWRCYIEARNLSVILYGKDINREIIAGEIIQ